MLLNAEKKRWKQILKEILIPLNRVVLLNARPLELHIIEKVLIPLNRVVLLNPNMYFVSAVEFES